MVNHTLKSLYKWVIHSYPFTISNSQFRFLESYCLSEQLEITSSSGGHSLKWLVDRLSTNLSDTELEEMFFFLLLEAKHRQMEEYLYHDILRFKVSKKYIRRLRIQ